MATTFDISALEHEVAQETAAYIARVNTLIARVRESGARINKGTFVDFATPVFDAAQDLSNVFRRAAGEMEDDAPRENPLREHCTYDASSIYGGRL